MMVSATWFLWDLLYASTSRWLNWSVAERTHMVSLVPSSGLLLVVELLLLLLPPHAAMPSARTATAATLRGPRQRLPDAILSPFDQIGGSQISDGCQRPAVPSDRPRSRWSGS